MKILIINASPRRKGSISQLLEAMRAVFEQQGHEVCVVRTAELPVKHCTGCMTCRTQNRCCLPEDGAQLTLEKIQWCQLLVVGAPCYWGNMPGELKVLFDRIVYGMMGETRRGIPLGKHKGKRAVVVSTSTTPFPLNVWFGQTRGVVRALKEILKYSGFKLAATFERGGTKNKPLNDKDLHRVARLAEKVGR